MRFDVVVIGLGGMGCAALYELASRGARVVGLDRDPLPSERGGTQGPTRTFREAYFTDARYVAMARSARARWLELAEEAGEALFEPTGALFAGPEQHEVMEAIARTVREHGLPHERLTAGEIARRWPALRPADHDVGVHEERAGLLRVPATMRAHASLAVARGATVREGEPALALALRGDHVEVRTALERYEAAFAVVTLGAWLGCGLGGGSVLGYRAPLTVARQPQLFFDAPDDRFAPDALCPFNYAVPDDPLSFYGAPDRGRGVMVARHYGGRETTGDAVDRALAPRDEEPVRAFLRAHLPALDVPVRDATVGLYANTPDRHFLLGLHPTTERVVIAGGFSGHGYKFAPIIGEIAADLVLGGSTPWDIDLFATDRFGSIT